MLDERKASILRAVVSEYIETAQPVGSTRVTHAADIGVSAATVRHEMVSLEREGYLVQPHTSAGRIPTDKGYRFFVDHLSGRGALKPAQRYQVRQFFAAAHGELELLLDSTSKLLSRLTDYAAVVVGPTHQDLTVRSVQLVALAPRLVLLVVVLADGAVEKRAVELSEDLSEDQLSAAGACLAGILTGNALGALSKTQYHQVGPAGRPVPRGTGDPTADHLVGRALDALHTTEAGAGDHLYVGGAARMAEAFDAVETVRSILGILEQQFLVVSLLRDILDRGLTVAIGAEHGVVPLAECSVVVAPFGEGSEAGTIGVLGPTRMDYSKALAAVSAVSDRLGHHLSEA